MQTVFPLCSVRVMAASAAAAVAHDPPRAASNGHAASRATSGAEHDRGSTSGGEKIVAAAEHGSGLSQYSLVLQQSLDDGLYHDDHEIAGEMTLLVSNIAGRRHTHAISELNRMVSFLCAHPWQTCFSQNTKARACAEQDNVPACKLTGSRRWTGPTDAHWLH